VHLVEGVLDRIEADAFETNLQGQAAACRWRLIRVGFGVEEDSWSRRDIGNAAIPIKVIKRSP
jgi:hypothetical protein